jgi:subfamily B ATP-binding cassette protein HlyB/CyaB
MKTSPHTTPGISWILRKEELIWGLGSLCQINRIPFEPALVLQNFPPPYTFTTLLHALKDLGLRAESRAVTGEALQRQAFPCLAVALPETACEISEADAVWDAAATEIDAESSIAPQAEKSRSLILIAKADSERILYFKPDCVVAQALPVAQFADRFEPFVLLVAKESESVKDEAAGHEQPAFGFKWFVPELLKHKTIWRDILTASLAIQLLGLVTPLFTQVIIDKVVVHHTVNTLIVIAVALAFSMAFTAGMSWVRQYLVLHTGNRVDAVLGSRVFEHLFRLPTRYFEHRSTGVLVARLHGVETIREFMTGAAVTLILDLPFLLIFLAIMFFYSWLLSLIVLLIIGIITVLSVSVTPLLRERINHQFLLGARNQAFLTEYVSGMETVKSLQMEPQVNQRYGNYLADYLAAGFNTRQLSNSYNTVANLLEQLMTLIILCLGAWLVMNSTDFTIGMLVAFQMFAGRVSQPLLRLTGLWQEFQQADIAVKRLGDVMNVPTEPYSLMPSREAKCKGDIKIQALSFRYAEDRPYLYRDFNLELPSGKCVALMGPSGSGKSTLAKLLQGFYQPSDGQIMLDGRDIRYLSANELRNYFGVVPQETMLFSGTIYDNLIIANPHAGFEQVMQASKFAEIHDTIEQLPKGYQTEIGEHGVGLSGGQKQRIAIARALLKQPKVLIFDEATSNLDHHTAEHFARTINALKGKVSMLFVTHQLPRGLKVDEVVVLGDKAGDPEKRVSIVPDQSPQQEEHSQA